MKTFVVGTQWDPGVDSSCSYYDASRENWIWTGKDWKVITRGRKKRCPKNGMMFGAGWGVIHVPTIPIVKYASGLSEEKVRENFFGYLRTYVRNCLLKAKQTGLLFIVGGFPRIVKERNETYCAETNIGLYLIPQRLATLAEIQPNFCWDPSFSDQRRFPEWFVGRHDEKPLGLAVFNLKDYAKKAKS